MLRQRRGTSRAGRAIQATALGLALAFVATASVVADPQPAFAADYPSWDELQDAKANTEAGAAAVVEIEGLIVGLESNVASTRAEAEKRTDELIEAQQKFDEAVRRADELQQQADDAASEAAEAEQNAGQVAAQLYRSGGGGDLSVNLLLDQGDADATDALLAKLGNMSKMVERTSVVYERASEDVNTAESLGDQAEVARGQREQLRIKAEKALQAAQEAQAAAESALAESESKRIELEQQLEYLKDTEAQTSADYQEGERKRKAEEERRRKEEERKRREAAAAAAEAAGNNGGNGGGGGGDSSSGGSTSSGWATPAYGWISGSYGPRDSICSGGYCSNSFHYATDLATGCWSPIYAATSGTVEYAGWSGSYGNFVKIRHSGGISTGYAHIVSGGTLVGSGQWVNAGQQIAWSGTTGASTGCHLHFEVYDGWNRINPVPFMAARGVYLG